MTETDILALREQLKQAELERDEALQQTGRYRRVVQLELERVQREFCSSCGNNRGLLGRLASDMRCTTAIENDPVLEELRATTAQLREALRQLSAAYGVRYGRDGSVDARSNSEATAEAWRVAKSALALKQTEAEKPSPPAPPSSTSLTPTAS